LSSAQLFEVDVERLYQVADTVIGTVGLRYQPRYAGADHDLAIRWVERRKIEILQHFGHPRLKSHGQVAAHRERVSWNRVQLPQEDQIATLVMAALRGGFELLAVQLAGIDFMVVERFERRGMAAGKDRADVFVGVEPGLAQPIGWEQMARGRGRVGKRETVTFDFGDRLDARRGISSRGWPNMYWACRPRRRRRRLPRPSRPDGRARNRAVRTRRSRACCCASPRSRRVARCDKDLDLAAEFIPDQISDLLVDRDQTSRSVIRLDAEAHCAAVGADTRFLRHGARSYR